MEHRSLLVSDLDNTLLGDDRALANFADWYTTVRGRLRLVYNSGRFTHSIRESIRTTALPIPDAIIGGVGTEIYFPANGCQLSNWPPHSNSWNAGELHEVLCNSPELTPQPTELQSNFKVSFYGSNLLPEALRAVRHQLRSLGYDVEVIYSSNRDLDVLPAGVNKGSAAAHLARHWNIDSSQVVVCGDSGNDLSLFQQNFLGVTVGNAHAVLRQLDDERVYHAAGGYAAGVMEGMRWWLDRMPMHVQ